MENLSEYKIKDYQYWSVSISKDQVNLGKCVIWCKREDALDLAGANKEEQEELFLVLLDVKKAIKKAFQADWFNYAFLGNKTPHLHCHIIPRYSSSREFEGQIFTDEKWGKNPYKGDLKSFDTPEILEKIRVRLKEILQ